MERFYTYYPVIYNTDKCGKASPGFSLSCAHEMYRNKMTIFARSVFAQTVFSQINSQLIRVIFPRHNIDKGSQKAAAIPKDFVSRRLLFTEVASPSTIAEHFPELDVCQIRAVPISSSAWSERVF